MKKGFTSIIINLYDPELLLRRFTQEALSAIRQYTDDGEYEIILIDNEPRKDRAQFDLYKMLYNDRVLKVQDMKVIVNEVDQGHYKSINQGAEVAEGEYLVFSENDIIVTDNWLIDLRYYLENDLTDAIVADRYPRTREEYRTYKMSTYEESMLPGMIDQGLVMMKRDTWEKMGKWDENYFMMYGWSAFEKDMAKNGLRLNSTKKVFTHHIYQATMDVLEMTNRDKFEKSRTSDAEVVNRI